MPGAVAPFSPLCTPLLPDYQVLLRAIQISVSKLRWNTDAYFVLIPTQTPSLDQPLD